MGYSSTHQPPALQEDLAQSDLDRLRKAKTAAVDTELTGLNPNRDRLCLVQICDSSGAVNLVKSGNWRNAFRLKSFLEDSAVTKVFHFALMDCCFLQVHLGIEVQGVYCTKLASKLARTYSSEHSLHALLKEYFGIEVDKSRQTSDWLSPTLTPEQLEYAVGDVVRLLELRNRLDDLLIRKGTLPTGITYMELNNRCQRFVTTLVHLAVNGWKFGLEDPDSVFGH
jgi:ribonuclease D